MSVKTIEILKRVLSLCEAEGDENSAKYVKQLITDVYNAERNQVSVDIENAIYLVINDVIAAREGRPSLKEELCLAERKGRKKRKDR